MITEISLTKPDVSVDSGLIKMLDSMVTNISLFLVYSHKIAKHCYCFECECDFVSYSIQTGL